MLTWRPLTKNMRRNIIQLSLILQVSVTTTEYNLLCYFYILYKEYKTQLGSDANAKLWAKLTSRYIIYSTSYISHQLCGSNVCFNKMSNPSILELCGFWQIIKNIDVKSENPKGLLKNKIKPQIKFYDMCILSWVTNLVTLIFKNIIANAIVLNSTWTY